MTSKTDMINQYSQIHKIVKEVNQKAKELLFSDSHIHQFRLFMRRDLHLSEKEKLMGSIIETKDNLNKVLELLASE